MMILLKVITVASNVNIINFIGQPLVSLAVIMRKPTINRARNFVSVDYFNVLTSMFKGFPSQSKYILLPLM